MVRVQRVAVWIATSTLMQVSTKSSVLFEKKFGQHTSAGTLAIGRTTASVVCFVHC